MNNGESVVGWYFLLRFDPARDWRQAILTLAEAVAVLDAKQLLFPRSVTVSDYARATTSDSFDILDLPKVLQKVTRPEDFHAIIPQLEDIMVASPGAFPITVDVNGEGLLWLDDKPVVQHDLLHVTLSLAGRGYLHVRSSSDVWLPYSLRGKRQQDTYAAMAGRLASGLQQLERLLDSPPTWEDWHQFATGAGYYADNVWDIFGDLITPPHDD